MIRVAMGNEHLRERLAVQRGADLLDVLRIADAGIDQRRHAAAKQIRIVACRPRPRRCVPRA